MSNIIKQVEYYDPIFIDGRFDTRGRPTGSDEGTLIGRRFIVTESNSGIRKLTRQTFVETIRGDTEADFTESLKQAVKGRHEFAKQYSDSPNLIKDFVPPEVKPYLERTINYAK